MYMQEIKNEYEFRLFLESDFYQFSYNHINSECDNKLRCIFEIFVNQQKKHTDNFQMHSINVNGMTERMFKKEMYNRIQFILEKFDIPIKSNELFDNAKITRFIYTYIGI